MNSKQLLKLLAVLLVPVLVWNLPAPAGLDVKTWHIVAVYLGLLAGLVIKPFSEPVITLIIVGLGAMFVSPKILLAGYGDSMTWFIAVVTIVCGAFVKTGLGRRIAYNLLLKSSSSTLSLGYLMAITDLVLSPATGSNAARATIIYPIFRQIAEGVGSTPTNEPRKLGAYLTVLSYVISQSTSALFLTGMATNAITVSLLASMLNINLTWGMWFLASVVPVGLFLFVAPYVVYKVYPPTLKSLGDIKPIAKAGLDEMGPISTQEKILAVLFVLAVLAWMVGPKIPFVNLGMQVVGFVFLALVLLTKILNWDDVIGSKGAWNIFVWYGAFYGVATSLASAGFYKWLAAYLGQVFNFTGMGMLVVAAIMLFASLAVRYFFVSNSAFVASFYPVLFALILTTDVNPMVVGLLLAFFSPLGALLTHYGNGAGLVAFASGYVPQGDFWKVGTIMVGVGLVIFFAIGIPYWKLVGLW